MATRSLLLLLATLGARATDSLVSRSLSARGGIQPPIFYNLTIFHVNDIHARLDEFSSSGTDCTAPEKGCYGGYARIKHTVDELRTQTPNSVLLNAGDEFQGTLFYTFYHGEKIAETINQLGFDALTIGNHEFDGGDDQLGAFLKNLTFPVVCANIQSTHPDLNATIIPYTIIRKHQLAIIGVTTPDIRDISSPGPGTTFSDPVAAVQATINRLKRREPSVKRIIALTHIGYDKDKLLAQQTRGLDAIIGGHSHTLLGNITGAEGAYPTIETNLDGDEVFIVTSYRWGEYLGKIELSFGPNGKIAGYTGAPIHLTNTTAQDTVLQAEIEEWRQPFDEFAKEVIGESNSVLTNAGCKTGECTLGDVMTDAIVDYRAASVAGAIINGGGVRATIDVGPVTRGEVVTAFPFGNVVVEIDFTGEELWKIFEGIFSGVSQFDGRAVVAGVQVSKEIRLVYNPNGAVGSRLTSLEIGGQPVDLTKTYRIGTVDFLARGGDNQMPAQDPADIVTLDALDEVLVRYIQKKSPITAELEGRISTTS